MDDNDIKILLLRQVPLFGNQGNLARAIGVQPTHLSRYLRNETARPNSKIYKALGIENQVVKMIVPSDDSLK